MLDDAEGDVPGLDDRIAPVIEADQLREQLGAQPMTVAADPIDLQDLVHQATATRAGSEILRHRRRWCPPKSSANSCNALYITAAPPSGWWDAPRPVNWP